MNRIPLYPLRFEPIYQYRLWGGRRLANLLSAPLPDDGPIGEAWMLSDRDDHPSLVADGPLKGRTIGQLLEQSPKQLLGKLAGRFRRFPLLLKFLDVSKTLSVQVHPSDANIDLIPPGETGKTEAWVVLEAGPESRIYAGLKPGNTAETLREAIANGTVADHLASFTPKPGDGVLIRAGTVHSLSDVVVFEVQENSDVTFRLYDWDHVDPKTGQRRPLQVDQAMACIDFTQGAIGPVAPVVEKLKPAPARAALSIAIISACGESAENPRLQSAPRKRRACWSALTARVSWSTAASIMPSAKATCCFCRPSSEHVPAGRTEQSACWKFRCRRLHKPMKKLIVFDLDGTLAESKSSIDAEMAKLLNALLGIVKVSVISGGDWSQFEKQVLANLSHDERLKNLSLLPTCGTKFYQYESDWKMLYSEDFTDEEKKKIISSLKQATESPDFKVEQDLGR